MRTPEKRWLVWGWASGYFAAYVPYALVTKAISEGRMPGVPRVEGATLLPLATATSALGMVVFFLATGLTRHAPRRSFGRFSLPFPRPQTWASGLATALIVVTTTLAYTFEGVSIVLMMLLMRGGVLAIAPLVDRARGRHIAWYSWVGLGLSAAALLDGVLEADGQITLAAALDALVYVGSYFARLSLMTGLAKGDPEANRRYFVEEQLVATPVALALVSLVAWVMPGPSGEALRAGFDPHALGPALPFILIIGLCSQGTGIFGALVLLDARENTFSVPVNRASSVLAGVVATALFGGLMGGRALTSGEIVGAVLVVLAILTLSVGPMLARKPSTPVGPSPPR